MAQPVTFGEEFGLLGFARRSGLDLVEFEREQVKLALAGTGERLELLGLLLGGPEPGMGRRRAGPSLPLGRAAVLVQDLKLGAGEWLSLQYSCWP